MQTELTNHDKAPFTNADLRSWALVALATVVWIVLYNVIQPFANWLAYGLIALPQGSHLGEWVA
jgi:hypothetical protein